MSQKSHEQRKSKSFGSGVSPQLTVLICSAILVLAIIFIVTSGNRDGNPPEQGGNQPLTVPVMSDTEDGSNSHTEAADSEESDTIDSQSGSFDSTVVSYSGNKGTYTFGCSQQAESLSGLCLNPTYSEATSDKKVGFLFTPVNCSLWNPAPSNQTTAGEINDSVVLLNINKTLSDHYNAGYIDATQYGAMWNPEGLIESESQNNSSVYVRSVDLSTNTVLDIMEICIGTTKNGQYAILTVNDISETNPLFLQAVYQELNTMIGEGSEEDGITQPTGLDHYLTQPAPNPSVPISTNIDFTDEKTQKSIFVHRVIRPYGDYYIDAISQKTMNKGWLEDYSNNLYAVTVNIGGSTGLITLYMTQVESSDSVKMETIGYEILG